MMQAIIYIIVTAILLLTLGGIIGYRYIKIGSESQPTLGAFYGLLIWLLIGFIPGMLWFEHAEYKQSVDTTFQENFDGQIINAKRKKARIFWYEWIDENGVYRIATVSKNPFTSRVSIEEVGK